MREDAATKGRRYLGEGRLTIDSVTTGRVHAVARGDGVLHDLGHNGRRWYCDCPARTDRCCHLTALRLVVIRP